MRERDRSPQIRVAAILNGNRFNLKEYGNFSLKNIHNKGMEGFVKLLKPDRPYITGGCSLLGHSYISFVFSLVLA